MHLLISTKDNSEESSELGIFQKSNLNIYICKYAFLYMYVFNNPSSINSVHCT